MLESLYNCNAAEYLLEFAKILRVVSEKGFLYSWLSWQVMIKYGKHTEESIFLINYARGYICLGRYEDAWDIMEKISPDFPKNMLGVDAGAGYYGILFEVYYHKKDYGNAEHALMRMKEMVGSRLLKKKEKQVLNQLWEDKGVRWDMHNGYHGEAEKYWQSRLASAKTLIEKVHSHWYLAETYLHFGETKQAKESLAFVRRNAGDTVYAAWAEGITI